MTKIAFISALFGTVFMFLALGSAKAQAWGTCEDKIFHSGPPVGYFCDEIEQDETEPDAFCTWFDQDAEDLSFAWHLQDEESGGADTVLDCQCRKTYRDFETSAYEFLCTGFEEDDEEVIGITGKIFWKGGPIRAEGVEALTELSGGGGFILKCRPDPRCADDQ